MSFINYTFRLLLSMPHMKVIQEMEKLKTLWLMKLSMMGPWIREKSNFRSCNAAYFPIKQNNPTTRRIRQGTFNHNQIKKYACEKYKWI
uniref:Uncharacterized protein n=1 Tax=Drosophila melanogaster TaxID=7227 RepID=Q9NG77_DROME|nr:unknown [Drosophila melanogaster]